MNFKEQVGVGIILLVAAVATVAGLIMYYGILDKIRSIPI